MKTIKVLSDKNPLKNPESFFLTPTLQGRPLTTKVDLLRYSYKATVSKKKVFILKADFFITL